MLWGGYRNGQGWVLSSRSSSISVGMFSQPVVFRALLTLHEMIVSHRSPVVWIQQWVKRCFSHTNNWSEQCQSERERETENGIWGTLKVFGVVQITWNYWLYWMNFVPVVQPEGGENYSICATPGLGLFRAETVTCDKLSPIVRRLLWGRQMSVSISNDHHTLFACAFSLIYTLSPWGERPRYWVTWSQ